MQRKVKNKVLSAQKTELVIIPCTRYTRIIFAMMSSANYFCLTIGPILGTALERRRTGSLGHRFAALLTFLYQAVAPPRKGPLWFRSSEFDIRFFCAQGHSCTLRRLKCILNVSGSQRWLT